MAKSTTYAQLTSLGSAVALPTAPAGAYAATIQADGGGVRIRSDGTNPTGDVGYLIADGASLVLSNEVYGSDWTVHKVIQKSGATSKLNVLWHCSP